MTVTFLKAAPDRDIIPVWAWPNTTYSPTLDQKMTATNFEFWNLLISRGITKL